jgi:hypothetical protein
MDEYGDSSDIYEIGSIGDNVADFEEGIWDL